jgi:aminopeptidase N
LNEGFARFVEYIGLAAYNPDWDADTQRIVNAQGAALALDSSQYSHAIVQAVSDPGQIGGLFDSISYVSHYSADLRLRGSGV